MHIGAATMTWDASDTYREGLAFFTSIVDAVDPEAWQRPSPCSDWRALDVLGHVGEGTDMGVRILTGGDIHFERRDPPGSVVGDDPAAWWSPLAVRAETALADVDDLDREVDSPMGRRTVREGLSFPAVDLFVHGWDLGTATDQSIVLPDAAIAFCYALFEKVPPEAARGPGVFAAERSTIDGASASDRLIAFTGRDPDWSLAD